MNQGPANSDQQAERALARRNNVFGWSLFALALVLGLGTAAIALIFNAISSS
jgi:hypothetical protein